MEGNTQTKAIEGYDARQLQALAYETLLELGWAVKHVGYNSLKAYIHRSPTGFDQEISIATEDNQLLVASKRMNDDIAGGDEPPDKDLTIFFDAFETVRAKSAGLAMEEWKQKISVVAEEEARLTKQEISQQEQESIVANFSKANRFITYGIIVINALVFILMAVNGVNAFSPTGADIINWGGNYGPLTLSGDWWRLITNVFVHIGIIHIAFNMYALFMVGVYLEPMLGKLKYATAYLCTGIFASIVSLWWHKEPVASAGASGAIFGLYGVFLALLSTNLVPKHIRNSLLQSIGIFIAYNLIYGMRSGVDNSAHIGGLISGLAIGYIYYFGLRKPGKKSLVMPGALAVITIAVSIFYLNQHKASKERRAEVLNEVGEYKYADAARYDEEMTRFGEVEKKALAPLKADYSNQTELTEQLGKVSLPAWKEAEAIVARLQTYKVSEKKIRRTALLDRYVSLRKEQTLLMIGAPQDSTKIRELLRVNKSLDSLLEKSNEPN